MVEIIFACVYCLLPVASEAFIWRPFLLPLFYRRMWLPCVFASFCFPCRFLASVLESLRWRLLLLIFVTCQSGTGWRLDRWSCIFWTTYCVDLHMTWVCGEHKLPPCLIGQRSGIKQKCVNSLLFNLLTIIISTGITMGID